MRLLRFDPAGVYPKMDFDTRDRYRRAIEELARRLGLDLELFSRGGMEILRRIERQNYNVLTKRPFLNSQDKAMLAASVFIRWFFSRKNS